MHSLHFWVVPILSLPVFGILFVLLIQLLEMEELCALPLILALWAMKWKEDFSILHVWWPSWIGQFTLTLHSRILRFPLCLTCNPFLIMEQYLPKVCWCILSSYHIVYHNAWINLGVISQWSSPFGEHSATTYFRPDSAEACQTSPHLIDGPHWSTGTTEGGTERAAARYDEPAGQASRSKHCLDFWSALRVSQ